MEAEAKQIEIQKNTDVVAALEVTCPFCKHLFEVELELVKSCSSIYCSYCMQKMQIKF